MKTRLTAVLCLVAVCAGAQVVNYPGQSTGSGGGATNGIQMLNGSGTNTTLHNLNIVTAANDFPGNATTATTATKIVANAKGTNFVIYSTDGSRQLEVDNTGVLIVAPAGTPTIKSDAGNLLLSSETVSDHVYFTGIMAGDASGLTNIANGNVVVAGSGVTVTTNTTAGTGTKSYTIAATGGGGSTYIIPGSNITVTTNTAGSVYTIAASAGANTTISNTASEAGVLVGGNGSYGVGTTSFYRTNSGTSKTYTNLFGGSWDNSGASPIMYVSANTWFDGAAQGASRVGGYLELDGDSTYWLGDHGLASSAGDFYLHDGTVNNLTVSGTTTFSTLSATTLNVATLNVTNFNSIVQTNGYLFASSNGTVIATQDGEWLTNLVWRPNTITLFNTNAAMLTNCESYLVMTNNILFTNWATVAVAGQWGGVWITNSTATDYILHIPTNSMSGNLTNSIGCFVQLGLGNTNWACTISNRQTAELRWRSVGSSLGATHTYVRHW